MNKDGIRINNMYFGYSKHRYILKDINLDIINKGVYSIFGPNGSGKTTLAKCICSIYSSYSGKIKIYGENLNRLKKNKLSKLISYVPQDNIISFPYIARDIIRMGKYNNQNFIKSSSRIDKYTNDVITKLKIENIADKFITQLSGGERQLINIARAINQDTPIIILDEPNHSLDYGNQFKIMDLLKELSKSKIVILTEHEPNRVEYISDYCIIINKGKIITYEKSSKQLINESINKLYPTLIGKAV